MDKREEMIYELEQEFRMMFRKLKKDVNDLFGENFTSSEFIFLRQLQCGRQRVSDLAKAFQVSNSHATSVTDKLVEKSYVKRERSEKDRRVVELEITEEGKALFAVMEEKRLRYMYNLFDVLTDDEIQHTLTVFRKIKQQEKEE
ncbi:MarR family transcriptional regulator [Bacillus tianshenii]|nr:MarR family transcriptional regulator [Bacillus tianshenii]